MTKMLVDWSKYWQNGHRFIGIPLYIWCGYGICKSCMAQNKWSHFYVDVLCCHCQHLQMTQITCNPLMNARASPSVLKAGVSTPVKAVASLLMWSVISSELALLQHGGSRSVGKKQCEREGRKCVFISVGGAWFPLWSVSRPAPGPPCGQQKP